MEQLTMFPPPYKYLIDASSIFAQKITDSMPRAVHNSMWKRIDESIREKTIVTCSEIEEEVHGDKVVGRWLIELQCDILQIDDEVQYNVRRIVTEHPQMIAFSSKNGSSSGDAFLIATAMKYGLIIITEENKTKNNKIPIICSDYGIRTVNLTELCIEEGWRF
ncbi:MAG: DUF4411 family protein [Clostridia bacterium]|nr:DUF4411 family protein [Clostridia bacterium]